MTNQVSCPHCETIRDVELVEREEKVTIKGREVTFKAQLSRCTTCDEEFESADQLDANLIAAREAYARLYEAPTPEQLVTLRSRYGASQKAFGLILGFGELTMNSYEQGAIPDSSNRLLLKLAENPVLFKAMYAMNSPRIGALQRKRIESSPAFQSAEAWTGLGALASGLTPVQRSKLEACAECYEQSILQQVIAYVVTGSFTDYSSIFLKATWKAGKLNAVLSQFGTSNVDALKAAS